MTTILAWLIIPAISLYAPVRLAPIMDNGTPTRLDDYYELGPAINYLEDTSWVDDGWGRVVLAAHNAGWFAHLDELQQGDRIMVVTATKVYEFEVMTLTTVYDDVRVLAPTDTFTLTLLTCEQRGVTWLVVDAREVP